MSLKLLTILTIISFCCQVIFSIYYSTTIVDQNTLINDQQTVLDRLIIKNEQLRITFSDLNSLSTIVKFSQTGLNSPITSSVNLN